MKSKAGGARIRGMGTHVEMQNENHNPPSAGATLFSRGPSNFPGAPTKNFSENHSLNTEAPSPTAAGVIVQPGEYHPGYCDQMLAFFDRPKMRETIETFTYKSGAVDERVKYVPNTPPHFSEFARKIGVTTRTLKKWAKEHPDFREAYDQCQEIFEEFMIDNGLTGGYGAIAMKFVAVNRTKMRDKTEHTEKRVDMNRVLDDIAAGKALPGGRIDGDDSSGDDF